MWHICINYATTILLLVLEGDAETESVMTKSAVDGEAETTEAPMIAHAHTITLQSIFGLFLLKNSMVLYTNVLYVFQTCASSPFRSWTSWKGKLL